MRFDRLLHEQIGFDLRRMTRSRQRLVGLWTIIFFAAAVLCSTITAAMPANAAEMPDCSKQSAAADPAGTGASFACAFELV
jgi:hypothetical protein